MTLDLYSYGRAQRDLASSSVPDAHASVFTCEGCGCSAATREPALIRTLGWRILGDEEHELERRAVCPGCSRRMFGRLL